MEMDPKKMDDTSIEETDNETYIPESGEKHEEVIIGVPCPVIEDIGCKVKEKKKIKLSTAIFVLALSLVVTICLSVLGTVLVIDRMGGNTLGLSRKNWDKLKWGFSTVDNLYYEDVKEDELVEGALMGLSLALDEYSGYMPAQNADEFMQSVNAEDYCGVGMYISSDSDKNCVRVISAMPGSPAEKADIKEDDIIKAVDGKNVDGDVSKASELLMGDEGTEVVVTIIRAENGATEEITMKRAKIKQDIISSKMVGTGIGYIQLTSFGSETYEHFVDELNKLEEQGMKKLVIDVRDNPGGYVDSATAIAEVFLDKDKLIISTKNKSGHVTEYRSATEGINVEVVILCNEQTASAAEILAVALKDNGKAKLVGKKTYGKGVIQAMIEYGDGSMFKVTEARYYAPLGECIDKKGIKPDIDISDDENTKKDEQLEAAINELSGK